MVTFVTPPVKPATLRTMPPAVFWTPRTIEAAKAAPGKVGRLTGPDGREDGAPPVALAGVRAG